MTKKRIHLVYGIVLSVVAVIAGICLIAACISIYNTGDRPFTPEKVSAAFRTIAFPVYLFVGLVIGGFILDGFFPTLEEKNVPIKQYDALLEKQYLKNPALKANKERRSRLIHNCIGLSLLAVGSVVFLCYGMNGANFDTQDITGSMVKAMYVLLPCMAVPFCYAVFAAYYARSSMRRELELLKQATTQNSLAQASKKQGAEQTAGQTASAETNEKLSQQKTTSAATKATHQWRPLIAIRWAILAVGIFLLIFGFCTGGTQDVLTKAVNICTECVGLG